jgi:hypothetical protein
MLNPGEWVRIIGKGKFVLPADGSVGERIHSGHAVDHAYAQVSLYRLETLLTPTATGFRPCARSEVPRSLAFLIPVPPVLLGLEV